MNRPGSRHSPGHFMSCCRRARAGIALALLTAVTMGCGGGSGTGGTPAATPDSQGIFVDSPVSGLGYSSSSTSGVTNAQGVFYFNRGETVAFTIGRLRLGEASGAALLSPLDLVHDNAGFNDPRVMALSSLLQSLDLDGDPANSISYNSDVEDLVNDALGGSDLDLSTVYALTDAALATALADLDTLIRSIVTSAVASGLSLSYVSPDDAANHLIAGLSSYMAAVLPVFDPAWPAVGAFTNAERCAQCHLARDGSTALRDSQGNDVSPSHDWQYSVMAHALDDPYFQAVLEEESTHEFPQFAGLIEDRCLNCHAPMGYEQAHATGTGLDTQGFYRLEQAKLDMHAREGVSCTLCHQLGATDSDGNSRPIVGEDASNGEFSIGDARIIYGPFGDSGEPAINPNPMQSNVSYTPQFGHQTLDSGHCASCHTVRTPVMDILTGEPALPARQFLEQGPYYEWLNSVFARGASEEQHCQDCHMPEPEANYSTEIATRPNNLSARSPYRRHTFLGGNAYLLELLRNFGTVLGISPSAVDSGFDEAITVKRDFLGSGSADLEILRTALTGNDTLEVDVKVTNHGGHKLPTSYPSRRAWIHLRVVDNSSGDVIFESGAPSANGHISTDAAHLDPACLATLKPAAFDSGNCFEPHRDVIDSPSQIAIYESVLADSQSQINHVLLYADGYLKDNRIPPRGFTAAGVVDDTGVVGVGSDADFNIEAATEGSGSDRVHYRIAVNQPGGPFTVEARLLYQTIRPAFIGGLHSDAEPVERFRLMTKISPPPVETLASASTTLP